MTESQNTILTLEGQRAIDHYLNKRLIPTGIVGAMLGAIVSFAVQQGAQAAAKEAVATGLGTMTQTVFDESKKVDAARAKAEEATAKIELAARDAQEAQQLSAQAQQQLPHILEAAQAASRRVQELNQDADKFEQLLEAYKTSVGVEVGKIQSSEQVRSDIVAELRRQASTSPIGCVVAWPTAAAVPAGWMVCDGAVLDAKAYPEIAIVLDKTYGAEGPEKVKLPDFRGRFLRGVGGSASALGSPQDDALQDHQHGVSSADGGGKGRARDSGGGSDYFLSGHVHQDGGKVRVSSEETRPKNYAVHWIIRVR
ncbi:MAG: phage tail protein [Planctomycetota bacterium]